MGGDAWYNVTVRNDTQYFSNFDYYASKGVGGVDFRAKNLDDINNLEENSIDFYASVKSLYLQDRRKRILNATGSTQTQDLYMKVILENKIPYFYFSSYKIEY